jgi:FKBP-type peptidyl-prolyl cis-trans isomerase
MRRMAAAALAALAACAVVAGCGSSPGSANAAVTVKGSFGKSPTVTIPAETASTDLAISTPIQGSGAALKSGDSPLANIALYKWSGTKHSLLYSTFLSGPQIIPPQLGLTGLTDALKNAHLGSRVVAVLPPKYAYGSSGESQLGVKGTDTLVWVIDLLQQYSGKQSASGKQVSSGGNGLPSVRAATSAGQAPDLSIPPASPPTGLSVTTLIKGSGPKLTKGDTVVAQYVGAIWRTGKVFASSWPTPQQPNGQLFGFRIGGNVIAGFTTGLTGVPVGSRVMLVIPPSLGYGPAGGNANAGIQKDDTLVFVVDVLGSTKTG